MFMSIPTYISHRMFVAALSIKGSTARGAGRREVEDGSSKSLRQPPREARAGDLPQVKAVAPPWTVSAATLWG
jgi:hypothetical protein